MYFYSLDSPSDVCQQYALVIDGRSLALCIENHKDKLREVTLRVVTVLCCRMSPLQKAQVMTETITESSGND